MTRMKQGQCGTPVLTLSPATGNLVSLSTKQFVEYHLGDNSTDFTGAVFMFFELHSHRKLVQSFFLLVMDESLQLLSALHCVDGHSEPLH